MHASVLTMNDTSSLAQLAGSRRPQSLVEVLTWGLTLGGIDAFLREFMDEFYTQKNPEKLAAMIEGEPPLGVNDRANAYLAAVAEHLARRYGLPIPAWTEGPGRALKLPFFPCGLESLKATLLIESPIAFRRRMIFVDADPLYRPRRDAIGIGETVVELHSKP